MKKYLFFILLISSSIFINALEKEASETFVPSLKVDDINVVAECNTTGGFTYTYDIEVCQKPSENMNEFHAYIRPDSDDNWIYAGVATRVGATWNFTLVENTSVEYISGTWIMQPRTQYIDPVDIEPWHGYDQCSSHRFFNMPQAEGDCGEDCSFIETVNLWDNSYVNESGASDGNYADYTAECIPIFDTQIPQITIDYSQINSYVALFIDLNGDGDFCDTGEQIFNSPNTGGNSAEGVSLQYAIDNGIITGGETVRVIVSNSPISCDEIPECGEVEDYVLCGSCEEEVVITANGQDITDTLEYVVPCDATCFELNATNISNAVYNTSASVLTDLEGIFCFVGGQQIPFTAYISGIDSCGDEYYQEINILIEDNCCDDEPYIEPFWEFCDDYEVCNLEDWPVHVLGTNGDALLEIEGYSFEWSTGSTADHIFGVTSNQEITVKVTYPDGCEYDLTYYKECCTDSISVSFNECPEIEMLPILEEKLENHDERYSIPTRGELRTAIGVYRELDVEEYIEKGCDPCEAGWVTGTVLDGDGNPITNFDSITFTNNSTNVISSLSQNTFTARVDISYTVTVVVTDENGITCTYTYDFIYECETVDDCRELSPPTNLQQVGSTLTWDPVAGAVSYIVVAAERGFCDCENQVSMLPINTDTNYVEVPDGLQSRCFAWRVIAVCDEELQLGSEEYSCFTPIKSASIFENVSIYPNPSKGEVTFEINATYDSLITIEVFSFYGNRIKTFERQVKAKKSNTIYWNAKTLNKGVYFVKFKTDKETIQKQIIIN